MKLVLAAPLAALALIGAGVGAYLWVTAEGAVEEVPRVQEPLLTPTPTAPPEPAPTPSPIPDDWLTYTDPDTGVTLRYPPDWVVERRDFPDLPVSEVSISSPSLTATVSLYGCCPPKTFEAFFEPWICTTPEQAEVGGIPVDRCAYTEDNPLPGGFVFAPQVASILYTLHAPDGDLYVSISIYAVDDMGTVAAEDVSAAEQIVRSLQVR